MRETTINKEENGKALAEIVVSSPFSPRYILERNTDSTWAPFPKDVVYMPRIGWFVFAAGLLLGLTAIHPAAAQTCPVMPQNPNDMTAWAQNINNCLPQAVMQQTVGLGTFEAAPPPYQGMFWNPDLVRCVFAAPVNGVSQACKFPPPMVQINSFNVQYQIAIRDNPGNSGLRVVLSVPTLHGSKDYPGNLDPTGTMATVSFHPDTIGLQELKFMRGGVKVASYPINTTLQPQLGAFVAPYLPVAVIYQPPGSTSYADFTTVQSFGTTLCWGTSTTSGAGEVMDASLFFGKNNRDDVERGIAKAAGAAGNIPGPAGTAAKIIGGVLDTLDSAFHIQTTSTTSQTQGRTLCKGSDVSVSQGYESNPTHGDRYVLRKDALFVYVVVLKDPASGLIVPTNGVPTVILTLVHSTPNAPFMDDLQNPQNNYPAELIDQFRNLDLQLNAEQLKRLIAAQNQPGTPAGRGVPPLGTKPWVRRLKPLNSPGLGLDPLCYYDGSNQIGWSADYFTSSDMSEATTTTKTTNVSGFVASILGEDGVTTQSFTLSTNQTNWEKYGTTDGIYLQCPEINPPYLSWNMSYYLDTLFGTILAVPGEKNTTTNPEQFAGTVLSQNGTPMRHGVVILKIGGKNYRGLTDANGKFIFRSPSLPKGAGALVVGNKTFPITYNGTPQTHLTLSLSNGAGPRFPGRSGTDEGVTPVPMEACCKIISVNARTGWIEAKENASGRVFKFEVNDPQLRSSLKVGQSVYANFNTREVSLDGRAACCSITALPEMVPLPR